MLGVRSVPAGSVLERGGPVAAESVTLSTPTPAEALVRIDAMRLCHTEPLTETRRCFSSVLTLGGS